VAERSWQSRGGLLVRTLFIEIASEGNATIALAPCTRHVPRGLRKDCRRGMEATMATSADDQMIVADGHRLRLRWFARKPAADSPVILFLHQGLGSVSQWRRFPEQLAAASGCAAVGYDRWGHGGSAPLALPRPTNFLEHEAERSLPAVLDALGLARVILYGHSDGGSIALLAAAALPLRVTAVISEAAHVFSEAGTASRFAQVIADFESGGLRDALARHHGDNVDAMFRGWADVWRSPAMQNWSMISKLPAVACPTLVIQGADDSHGSQVQVDAIARGVAGPVETLVLPDIGHAPHLEATAAVVAGVAAFLARAGWEKVAGG
jgi:pimeloyl-ACP methyl ester carboxylesterase